MRWWVVFAVVGVIFLQCLGGVRDSKPESTYFTTLNYTPARTRYRQIVEQKFKERDLSYILSLLSYGITSFYDYHLDDARKAFFAAYKIDAGERPEAAKIYDWLVVDSRAVYKLRKRERELVHFYLGLCYLMVDDPARALVEFKKLRQYDQDASKLPIVNFYLGMVYEKLGKFDDARIEYRQLQGMAEPGSVIWDLAQMLIAQIDSLEGLGGLSAGSDTLELVVQVDHQTEKSLGRTEVYIEPYGVVATLPERMDSFAVRLSGAEATRKVAQEVGAMTARGCLRLLGEILLERSLPGKGKKLAQDIADITLGKEEENRDIRAWGYAPLNFSFIRLNMPAGTEKVRLVFYDRFGVMRGYCDYYLTGEKKRAGMARRHKGGRTTYFIIAGLAEEFYGY